MPLFKTQFSGLAFSMRSLGGLRVRWTTQPGRLQNWLEAVTGQTETSGEMALWQTFTKSLQGPRQVEKEETAGDPPSVQPVVLQP